MYRPRKYIISKIGGIKALEGETIEQKLVRVLNNEETIKDGAPIIFTERKDGVRPEFDVRTDRWEIAAEAMDKVAGAKIAKAEGVADVKMEVVKEKTTGEGDKVSEA